MANATTGSNTSSTNAAACPCHPMTPNPYPFAMGGGLQDMYYDMMQSMNRLQDEMNRMHNSMCPSSMTSHGHYRSPFRYNAPALFPSIMDQDFMMPTPPVAASSSALAVPPTNFSGFSSNIFRPKVDIRDEGDKLVVHADLPGIEKEDVKVDVVNGMLNISAEHKEDKTRNEANFQMQERFFGKFYRSVPLPEGVKEDEIRAAFNQGVLEVKLPKLDSQKTQKKSIAIE